MQHFLKRSIFAVNNTQQLVSLNARGFSDRFKNKEQAEEKMFMDKEESNKKTLFINFLGKAIKRLLQKLESDTRIESREDTSVKDEEILRAKVKY
jgi:hypothetical protein